MLYHVLNGKNKTMKVIQFFHGPTMNNLKMGKLNSDNSLPGIEIMFYIINITLFVPVLFFKKVV